MSNEKTEFAAQDENSLFITYW